ncbi:MAG: glycosyltransferase involved in cell wall biosynthesis [Cyclobacteriaceae bacterium]|jgi:glycosyltransferase involved in cell wall biosynthesis
MLPVKISAFIITYNEEDKIARCIKSLRAVCDEIIVVDSYSTDKTVEISNSLGVKVTQNPFEGYKEQKNYALSLCQNEWVISLDADEELSSELQKSIKRLNSQTSENAFYVRRRTNFCGQWIMHCGWYPDKKIRLFRKSEGHIGGKNPHDRVIITDSVAVKPLSGDLLHFSYSTISEHVHQINRFSTIGAYSAFEKHKKPNFIVQVLLDPIYTFVKKYILQLGFLDGYFGFVISINTAHSKFLKYVKLREIYRTQTTYDENTTS